MRLLWDELEFFICNFISF